MEIKKEPKVLVIAANPFSDINNNGKTLKSIFSAFKKESLCELYFRPQDNVIGDGEYASSYYAVCDMDIIRSFAHFSSKCGGIQVFEKAKNEQVASDKTYQWFLHGSLKDIKWLRTLMWKTRKWDTNEYRQWYHECNPDVVFALLGALGSGASYIMAQEISKELNIPLAVYFTDDYLIHPIRKTWSDKRRYKSDLKEYKAIVNNSSALFTIGEQMSLEYSKFFNKHFDSIMNSVDVYPFTPKEPSVSVPVISYFGGLNLNRWKMISRVSNLVKGHAQVIVYTGQEITEEIATSFNEAGVILGGFLKGNEVREKMLESDILLHIESDDSYYRALTALSVSTKIPEYMMSSRPVIAFGPQEIASMRVVSDNSLGVAISSEDTEENQKEKLLTLLSDKNLQYEYARKAHEYASRKFNRDTIARALKEKLSEIAWKNH